MQNPLDKAKERLIEQFRQFENSLNGQRDSELHRLRRQAISRFEQLGFPARKDEDWKYSPVTRVVSPDYVMAGTVDIEPGDLDQFTIEGLDACRLVFINGEFREELSDIDQLPSWIRHGNLHELSRSDGKILQEYESMTGENAGTFESLNAAFTRKTYGLVIPDSKVVDKPIHFINLSVAGEKDQMVNGQKFVFAGTSSSVRIVDSYHSLGDTDDFTLNNVVLRFRLDDNSSVGYYKLQNESAQTRLINNTYVSQERDSRFTAFNVDSGGGWVRNNLSAVHRGQNVETNFWGAWVANGKQHIDNQTLIDHAIPHCVSNEHYKGIVTDKARAVFNGKVIVRQDAQKTNAFQQNNVLVLSPDASMNSKPQLEIFADDVRCSHGATTGQLDEQALFYMQSRGLSKTRARQMLQFAFIVEILNLMELEPVRNLAEQWFEQKLI